MRPILARALVALALLFVPLVEAHAWEPSPDLPPESRQFDFWIGEWDVDLRTLQADASWKDTHRATARIYPVLGGKAVLELWDSERIKGFSVRYFDTAKGKWVLWLNWPGKNRSGTSSLEGSFRHGRGDFTAINTDAEGNETISVYSFNDITPDSLRWDDAYSKDGGRTWTHEWIMEFSRTAEVPTLAAAGGVEHTWETGARCDLQEFRAYEALAGARSGRFETADLEAPARLTGYRVLDGCALLLFLDWGEGERFAHLTYNTYASRYQLLDLDAAPGTPSRVLYGAVEGERLAFVGGAEGERTRVSLGLGDGPVEWVEERESAAGWEPVWSATFTGATSP